MKNTYLTSEAKNGTTVQLGMPPAWKPRLNVVWANGKVESLHISEKVRKALYQSGLIPTEG